MNLIYLRYTNSLEDTALFSKNIKLNRGKKSVLMQTDHGSQSILFFWHGISSYQTCRILQTLRRVKVFKCLWVRTCLVIQWLRVHLPMQEKWVQYLLWEDPTCCRTTKHMCHNYWACALEPTSLNYWALVLKLLKPTHLEPVLHKDSSPHLSLEKTFLQQQRPSTAQSKQINNFLKSLKMLIESHGCPRGYIHDYKFYCSIMSNSLQPHGLQHDRLPCP